MARAYDIATAAFALDVDRKWLDNLASVHQLPGTEHFSRGVARRFSVHSLLVAAIVRDLQLSLAVPAAVAIGVATSATSDTAQPVTANLTPAASLRIDLPALQSALEHRLVLAMETVVPQRRGRPPRERRRGTR